MASTRRTWLAQPPLLFLVLLSLLSTSWACLKKGNSFGDTLTGAASFDDESNLISNFRNGMVVDTIYICRVTISNKSYIAGIRVNLINRKNSQTVVGTYYGKSAADFATGAVVCSEWKAFGTLIKLTLGKKAHYSQPSKFVISYARFEDD